MIWHTRSGTIALTMCTQMRASRLPSTSIALAAFSTIRRIASISMRAREMISTLPPSQTSLLAEGLARQAALDHQVERLLGRADRAHAVVDAARARGAAARSRSRGLRPAGCCPWARARCRRRMCMWPCGAWSSPNTCIAPMIFTPGVSLGTRIIDCCWCGGGVGAGAHHRDQDLAARAAGARDVVLLAVDDPLVAVQHRALVAMLLRVRRGVVHLGHRIGRADLAVQQRLRATAPSAPACPHAPAPPCCRCRAPSSSCIREASGFLPSSAAM